MKIFITYGNVAPAPDDWLQRLHEQLEQCNLVLRFFANP